MQRKTKIFFEAQLALANEHSKRIFNAAMPTRGQSTPDNTNKKGAPKGASFVGYSVFQRFS
jgi:hypothetical protein